MEPVPRLMCERAYYTKKLQERISKVVRVMYCTYVVRPSRTLVLGLNKHPNLPKLSLLLDFL